MKHFEIVVGETVHFQLEIEKTKRFKADSEFDTGMFLGYVWNTTEYIVGNKVLFTNVVQFADFQMNRHMM